MHQPSCHVKYPGSEQAVGRDLDAWTGASTRSTGRGDVSSKDISVVIPSLNSTTIDQTLDSLRAQTYSLAGAEIIVVGLDNPGLVKEDGIIRFVSTVRPVCAAAARNIGMQEAKGRYFLFIDSDCIAATDWIERLMARHVLGDKVVGGGVVFGEAGYWALCDNVSRLHEFAAYMESGHRPYLPTLNLSVHKEVAEEVGGFNETLPTGEDVDWTVRIGKAGYGLYFEPRAIVYHRPSRNNLPTVLKYAVQSGADMVQVRLRYPDVLQAPFLFRHEGWVLTLSPLISFYVTAKIFSRHLSVLRYFYTVPIVYLTKMGWCLGAARRVRSMRRTPGLGGG